MHNPHADESPFNAVPAVVVALAMVIAAVEIVLQLGESGLAGGAQAIGWRLAALEDYGFLPAVWEFMRTTGQFPGEQMLRFVSYPFLHGSFTHAAFAVVIVLAIGKAVGEIFAAWAVLAVFFVSSVFGALVVFGIFFGAGYDWIADVAGFIAGFLLSFIVSPGGWARVVAKLRRD